jgi:aminopeptidase Y
VETSVINEQRMTTNVLAETTTGDPTNVLMAGSHLDSVPAGPGINDNGSGVAALLETAEQIADEPVTNKVRFAFWAAEELGLLGSDHYVASLGAGTADIRAYLNFDMIASPNWSRMVYDGDDSDGGTGGPGAPGSGQIEALYVDYFAELGLPTVGRDIPNSSDYAAFTEVGIPIGGVHTGTDVIKTAEQAALFGGTANAPMDPCYHKACDTIANYSPVILDQNSDAIAYSIGRYALDLSDLPAAAGARSAAAAKAEPHGDES